MLLAANWKMNLTADEAHSLAMAYQALAESAAPQGTDILIFPPSIYASIVNEACADNSMAWGGQSSHSADDGAHTGDISAKMFRSMGASWLLAGHSERRQDHQETDEDIAAQIASAQRHGVHVILCVGETAEQRQAGEAIKVVCGQIKAALEGQADINDIVIAYEPVWAIGTGLVAETSDIEEMHQAISHFMMQEMGTPQKPRILYGGSVKAANAGDILALGHVDGALIGGASLKIEEFQAIMMAAG